MLKQAETKSVVETQRRFQTFYGLKSSNFPDRKLVARTVRRFRTSASVIPDTKFPRKHAISSDIIDSFGQLM